MRSTTETSGASVYIPSSRKRFTVQKTKKDVIRSMDEKTFVCTCVCTCMCLMCVFVLVCINFRVRVCSCVRVCVRRDYKRDNL